MPSTTALPSPVERHAGLQYEHHPELGDYTHSRGSWFQRRALDDARTIILRGPGRSPSIEQIALWAVVDSQLRELVSAAIAAVKPPPIKPRRRLFSRAPEFTRGELALAEIRIQDDGSYELVFDSPTGDRIDMWPIVTFKESRIARAEWAP